MTIAQVTTRKSACLAAAAFAALSLGAGVAQAGEVEIRNAVARVIVIPEDRRDVGVEITQGAAGLAALQVTRRGDDVIIDGGLERNAVQRCRSGHADATRPGDGARVTLRGQGEIAVNDAPLIVLRTPRDVDVTAGGGSRIRGGGTGAVYGSIGRGATSIELRNRGCGDWTVANTTGDLDIGNAGSGSIRAGNSGSLDVSVAGSGNVTAGPTGDADISIAGSGDVRVASARSAEISIAGSGDVRMGRLNGGELEVSIAGSGDVRIDGGEARNVSASIAGSGGVNFDGRAGDVNLSVMGSGDVRVREATGSVSRRAMGSGRIVIGGQ